MSDTKPLLLTDEDVMRFLSPTEAVAVMESVFVVRLQGHTAGMPRWSLPYRDTNLSFTVGAVGDEVGFRVYFRGNFASDDQLVAVWDQQTGVLRGLIVGELLGVLRTGAIGGVAVKYMARQDAATLAIIGSGRQAFSQLRAILAARMGIREVKVYSRTVHNREAFCSDVRELMPHLNIYAVDTAESAVRDSDIVIGATSSREPVIRGEWLKAGAHVTTIGPKSRESCEIDLEVVRRADFLATDSPKQSADFPEGVITEHSDKPLVDLAAIVGKLAGRPSDDAITLFLSVGLAGTEVALAARLLGKVAAKQKSDEGTDSE